jgi:hypothetical protein
MNLKSKFLLIFVAGGYTATALAMVLPVLWNIGHCDRVFANRHGQFVKDSSTMAFLAFCHSLQSVTLGTTQNNNLATMLWHDSNQQLQQENIFPLSEHEQKTHHLKHHMRSTQWHQGKIQQYRNPGKCL